jgi:hypothetical protein
MDEGTRKRLYSLSDEELDDFLLYRSKPGNVDWEFANAIRQQRQHGEGRKQHHTTQLLAKWGLAIGILALIVGLLAFARDWFPEVFRAETTTSRPPLSTSAPVSVAPISTNALRANSKSTTSAPTATATKPVPVKPP